jgi:hypothetical protein
MSGGTLPKTTIRADVIVAFDGMDETSNLSSARESPFATSDVAAPSLRSVDVDHIDVSAVAGMSTLVR